MAKFVYKAISKILFKIRQNNTEAKENGKERKPGTFKIIPQNII